MNRKIIYLIIALFLAFQFEFVDAQQYWFHVNTEEEYDPDKFEYECSYDDYCIEYGSFVIGTHLFKRVGDSTAKANDADVVAATKTVYNEELLDVFIKNDEWFWVGLYGTSVHGSDQKENPFGTETICITHVDGEMLPDAECPTPGASASSAVFNSRNGNNAISKTVYFVEGEAFNEPIPGHVDGYNACWTKKDSQPIDSRDCYSFSANGIADGDIYDAKYTAIQHTIHYDLNGGSSTAPSDTTCTAQLSELFQSNGDNGCKIASIGSSTKTGYDFVGWSFVKSTSTGDHNEEYLVAGNNIYDYLDGRGDVTLYAVWKPKEYTLTVQYQIGNDTASTVRTEKFKYTTNLSINLIVPNLNNMGVPDGNYYKFDNWTKTGAGTLNENKITGTGSSNITVVAHYSYKTVEFISDNNQYVLDVTCSFEDDDCTLTDVAVANVPLGKEFKGWKIVDTDVVLKGTFDHHVFDEDTVHVTPKFDYIDYVATIDLRGGQGSGYIYKYQINDNAINLGLANNNPTKQGYTFNGWKYANEGTLYGTAVNINNIQKIANLSIYADYSPNSVTIKFNNNETEIPNSSKICSVDATNCTITLDNPSGGEGQVFSGWLYNNAVYYKNSDIISLVREVGQGTITFEAYFTSSDKVYYDVIYDFGDCAECYLGSNPVSQIESTALSVGVPTAYRLGYTLDGWQVLGSNGTYTDLTNGTISGSMAVEHNGTTAVYLKPKDWTPIEFTFNFHGDGVPDNSKLECEYDEDCEIDVTVSRSGYSFVGWSFNDGGSVFFGNGINVKNFYHEERTVSLYAIWTPIEHNIYYYANGGTMPAQYTSTFTIETTGLTLPTPIREGFNFIEWKDLDGNVANVSEILSNQEDIVLVAQWDDEYDLMYRNTTDDEYHFVQKCHYGQPCEFGNLTEQNQGYRFLGYVDEDNNPVTSPVTLNDPTVDEYKITGTWTDEYKVYYRNTEDDEPTLAKNCKYGQSCSLDMVTARTNYRFLGYSDGSNTYTNTYLLSNEAVESVTFTGQWTNEYQISYRNTSELDYVTLDDTCIYGEECSVLADLNTPIEGYRFLGFVDESNNPVNSPFTLTDVTVENYKITGTWTNKYEVIFSYNYRRFTDEQNVYKIVECTYGEDCDFDVDDPIYPGGSNRTFLGWLDDDDTGVAYSDPLNVSNINITKVTFKAEWS